MGRKYGILRQEAEGTGLPLYLYREDVPLSLVPKSHCTKAKCPMGKKINLLRIFSAV